MVVRPILVFVFLILSVNAYCQLDRYWIGAYEIRLNGIAGFKYDHTSYDLYKLDNRHFIKIRFEVIAQDTSAFIDSVVMTNDTLRFDVDQKGYISPDQDSTLYQLSEDEIVYHDSRFNRNIHLIPLPQYRRTMSKAQLEKYLTSHIFKEPFNNLNVCFLPDHRLVYEDLDQYGDRNPEWEVVELADQLFLRIADFDVSMVHLKEISQAGFTLVHYVNDSVFLARLDKTDPFETFHHDFEGKWEAKEYYFPREDSILIPSPKQDVLIFKGSFCVNQYPDTAYTSIWESYLKREVLLLPEFTDPIADHQWEIQELTENKLVIKRRRWRHVNRGDPAIEIVEYHRIE